MHVDEAGHHVHALAVDLEVGIARFAIRRLRHAPASRPGAPAVMLVAFDDDVHRAERRAAGAVDQGDAADHHLLERPGAFTLLARGRGGVTAAATLARGLRRGRLRHRGVTVDAGHCESRHQRGAEYC